MKNRKKRRSKVRVRRKLRKIKTLSYDKPYFAYDPEDDMRL